MHRMRSPNLRHMLDVRRSTPAVRFEAVRRPGLRGVGETSGRHPAPLHVFLEPKEFPEDCSIGRQRKTSKKVLQSHVVGWLFSFHSFSKEL